RRRAGDLLHPERESAETLEKIRLEIGSLQYSAQYQQRPVPIEGNLIGDLGSGPTIGCRSAAPVCDWYIAGTSRPWLATTMTFRSAPPGSSSRMTSILPMCFECGSPILSSAARLSSLPHMQTPS